MTQKFLDTTTHKVAWFVKRAHDNELELSPPFQRNPVWSVAQKSYLIDTILHGYPIPEVYIQEFTTEDGEEEYVVVDGQQRLRACIEFVDNEFALVSSGSQKVRHEGKTFDEIPAKDRQQIYNYNFVVRKLPEMTREELRGIFSRLNRNTVALNAQELRNSVYWGEFIKSMENISGDTNWTKLGIFTSNDVRRMLDVEYISELAVAMLAGQQNKKGDLDDWYAANEEKFDQKKSVEAAFGKLLKEVVAVMPNLSFTRWSKKSDFYTLFYWLFEQVDELPWSGKKRRAVSSKLNEFAELVDGYVADPEARPLPAAPVRSYSAAVSKAASDLGSRRTRLQALKRFMDT